MVSHRIAGMGVGTDQHMNVISAAETGYGPAVCCAAGADGKRVGVDFDQFMAFGTFLHHGLVVALEHRIADVSETVDQGIFKYIRICTDCGILAYPLD